MAIPYGLMKIYKTFQKTGKFEAMAGINFCNIKEDSI